MRIYVASKFENFRAVRDAQDVVRAHGHAVTYDWTAHVAEEQLWSDDERPAKLREAALLDLGGVVSCDAIVLLLHAGMKGAWVELGVALAQRAHVLVVGDRAAHDNVFFSLPNVRFVPSLAELGAALDALREPAFFAMQLPADVT